MNPQIQLFLRSSRSIFSKQRNLKFSFLQQQYILMQSSKIIKHFNPIQMIDSLHLTPDHPDFRHIPLNLVILTKYGRGVYIRHGSEDRSSSFFATLGTIVNKLQISFGRGEESPANLKSIKQGKVQFFILRRLNFLYVTWATRNYNEITLYGMMDFVHHQLMSCLTGKDKQTYDPGVNFGKNRTEHLLLHYAVENGIRSIPIALGSVPVLPLPATIRSNIHSLLKQTKIQGLQINILMSLHSVVDVYKQKGVDLVPSDIFLFNNLLQSQPTLRSEIWYPICLPGIDLDNRVFCYINFLTDYVIHIMVSDQASIFQQLSTASKNLKEQFIQQGIFQAIHTFALKELANDPSLERFGALKHCVFRKNGDSNSLNQLVMSNGQYFGSNQKDIGQYIEAYAQLEKILLTRPQNKKQRIHIQQLGYYMGGFQEEQGRTIFFICSPLAELQDCRVVLNALIKYEKQFQGQLWIPKFI